MTQSRTNARIITKEVIKALGFAGAVTVALAAPNSTTLIDMYMRKLDKKNAQKTLRYLKYRKLIEVYEKKGVQYYRLTSKGSDKYARINLEEMSIATPKRWDGKWRLVMFDIPVTHTQNRKELLHKLRVMDFYMLQHSAWIHPFDCEKEIGVLLDHLRLEKYVSFLVVERGNFTLHAEEHFKKVQILM